jgi:2'-5' RNA ligase
VSGVRCFVGIALPDDWRRRLNNAARLVRESDTAWAAEKWVPAENLHITLKFIGDVAPRRLEVLSDALGVALAATDSFELAPSGLTAVPGAGRATMIWASFRDPGGDFARCARVIETAAAEFGARAEKREPVPHVTLARARRPRAIDQVTLDLAGATLDLTSFVSVPSATLFSSRLTSAGPVYGVVACWPLRRE